MTAISVARVVLLVIPVAITLFVFTLGFESCGSDVAAGKLRSQEYIADPNDPRVPIKVDVDLKQLFRGIELSLDMIDIERDIPKNGMKLATYTAQRRARSDVHGISSKPKPKPKKKKQEITKRTKLTNRPIFQSFSGLWTLIHKVLIGHWRT